jgi:large-conductance mechanosensitive channel
MRLIRDIFKDFIKYLKKHNVISLAVGFMIANSLTKLTESASDDIITPVFDPFVKTLTKKVDLDKLTLDVYGAKLKFGKFIKNFIKFLILGIVTVSIANMTERLF